MVYTPKSILIGASLLGLASAASVSFINQDSIPKTIVITASEGNQVIEDVIIGGNSEVTVDFPKYWIGNWYTVNHGNEDLPGVLGEVAFNAYNGYTYFDASAIVNPTDNVGVKQIYPRSELENGRTDTFSGCQDYSQPCYNCYNQPDDIQTVVTQDEDLVCFLGTLQTSQGPEEIEPIQADTVVGSGDDTAHATAEIDVPEKRSLLSSNPSSMRVRALYLHHKRLVNAGLAKAATDGNAAAQAAQADITAGGRPGDAGSRGGHPDIGAAANIAITAASQSNPAIGAPDAIPGQAAPGSQQAFDASAEAADASTSQGEAQTAQAVNQQNVPIEPATAQASANAGNSTKAETSDTIHGGAHTGHGFNATGATSGHNVTSDASTGSLTQEETANANRTSQGNINNLNGEPFTKGEAGTLAHYEECSVVNANAGGEGPEIALDNGEAIYHVVYAQGLLMVTVGDETGLRLPEDEFVDRPGGPFTSYVKNMKRAVRNTFNKVHPRQFSSLIAALGRAPELVVDNSKVAHIYVLGGLE
jgi:hypothetical protein